MADKTDTMNRENQTMQHEQAKASVSPEKDRQDEKSKLDKDRQEKSAIGGSQTGEPGRARSELGGSHPADKQGEFSKDREPSQNR